MLELDPDYKVSGEVLLNGKSVYDHDVQLAMLRRLAGVPMRGENYFVAEVAVGRVGAEQAAPRREFD